MTGGSPPNVRDQRRRAVGAPLGRDASGVTTSVERWIALLGRSCVRSAIAENIEFISIQIAEVGGVKAITTFSTETRGAFVNTAEFQCLLMEPVITNI